MSHPARPLRITIVSHDSSLLRELSWLLSAVDYTVETSKDLGENAVWRQFSDTDFVIVDGRSVAEPTQATFAHRSDHPQYQILLYDPAAVVDLTAWFAAGANDALRVPVSRGELLARLRAGARILEFESRMQFQSSRTRLPGMYSRRGILRKLSKFAIEGKSATLGHTLLITAIDFFPGFCRAEGELAAQGLLAALATSIQQNISGNALAAFVGKGTFQILLPGQEMAAARVIADQIAQAFRATQIDREPGARLSATTAIVPWQTGISAEQLLDQGLATLAIAEQSGGDCIIEQNEFAQVLLNWQAELTTGNPFANLIAQDIMEPFPAVLEQDSPNHAMLAALQRSGAPVWPLVDSEGRLIGVVSPEAATTATAVWGPDSNGNQALTKGDTIAHNAIFREISETFSAQTCQSIVVVAENRPVGYLTRSGFRSLIAPINSATYLSNEPVLEDSRGLLVGSTVNEPELASDSDPLRFHLPALELLDRSVLPASR